MFMWAPEHMQLHTESQHGFIKVSLSIMNGNCTEKKGLLDPFNRVRTLQSPLVLQAVLFIQFIVHLAFL